MEKLKKKIRNIIALSIFSNPEGGFDGYDETADKIIKLLEDEQSK